MTIDEAIKHCEEVAKKNENDAQKWHNLTKNRLVDFCDKAIQSENLCVKCAEEHRQLADWLIELKQLREQTRWIPVSDGLPEDSGAYLVSVIDEYYKTIGIDYESVGEVWFAHKKDYGIKESVWRKLDVDETVVAWKPLPKPYKADR